MKSLASAFGVIKSECGYNGKINPFFICFGCWMIISSILLLFNSEYNSFTSINHLRSFPADIFFTIFTDLGNGNILIPLAISFLIKKNYRVLVGILFSALIIALMVSWLKHVFNHPRPLACYGKNVVETASWIPLYSKYSFPSGHSATAFCVATYLSLSFSRDKYTIFISFAGACLTGYSRVYLGEHFFEDVWFGSMLGVLTAVITFVFVQYLFSRLKKRGGRRGMKFQKQNIRTGVISDNKISSLRCHR